MTSPAPTLCTTEEFDRRVAAANRYTYRPMALIWTPALIGFLLMVGAFLLGDARIPPWLGNVGIGALLLFGLGGLGVGLVREGRAMKRFGLLCPGCGQALPGGKHGEVTAHVRKTGCCRWCGAPVLSDHAGARDALARDAAATASLPHASAYGRAEFDALVARYRAGVSRWLWFIIISGLLGMPLLGLSTQLMLDEQIRRIIIMAGGMLLPVAVVGAVVATKMLPRRLGIECPACRKVPLIPGNNSVVRTGICPHCSAVIVRPAA